jgi:hypothetical protein
MYWPVTLIAHSVNCAFTAPDSIENGSAKFPLKIPVGIRSTVKFTRVKMKAPGGSFSARPEAAAKSTVGSVMALAGAVERLT